ncbi:MAG: histidine--tRNA ligase [Oscillospiraceae bacterium]|nr:histidine--tRNA ligase [Oscillospiraceae bacterium]
MAEIIKKIKGTEDIMPKDSYRWIFLEDIMRRQANAYGYKEVRTPVFEQTALFSRGVGETTDVVQKEMYTFSTKGDESITLRPEGTAGAARAFLEHSVQNDGLPSKQYYLTTCYRYEKPQAGRQREFHQFGIEVFGTQNPSADAEVISLVNGLFEVLGLSKIRLEINSIGCPKCRSKYHEKLKEYFSQYKDKLCDTCLGRLERNPMRIIDCKSPVCSEIAKDAPKMIDFLCEECEEHFAKVKSYLDIAGVKYEVNPTIVRGLDYYTKTVFEFVSDNIGAQGTVCGGGRYDGLIEELGGQHTPSLGCAMGIERLLLLIESSGVEIPKPDTCDLYIASMGENASLKAFALAEEVRKSGLSAQCDIVGRGLRPQMKFADKIGAKFSVVLGDNEIEENKAEVKNMETGDKTPVSLTDFAKEFQDIMINAQTQKIAGI